MATGWLVATSIVLSVLASGKCQAQSKSDTTTTPDQGYRVAPEAIPGTEGGDSVTVNRSLKGEKLSGPHEQAGKKPTARNDLFMSALPKKLDILRDIINNSKIFTIDSGHMTAFDGIPRWRRVFGYNAIVSHRNEGRNFVLRSEKIDLKIIEGTGGKPTKIGGHHINPQISEFNLMDIDHKLSVDVEWEKKKIYVLKLSCKSHTKCINAYGKAWNGELAPHEAPRYEDAYSIGVEIPLQEFKYKVQFIDIYFNSWDKSIEFASELGGAIRYAGR